MERFYLLILCLLITLQVSAQLNPVRNLTWDHWYDTPDNMYSLSWTRPVPSADTLIGYNIYRDTAVYVFTTDTSLYCGMSINPEVPRDCERFLLIEGFRIHVTAVYNGGSLESGYTDSAWCNGLASGIRRIAAGRTVPGFSIRSTDNGLLLLFDGAVDEGWAVLWDVTGTVLRSVPLPQDTRIAVLENVRAVQGICLLRITTKTGSTVRRIMLIPDRPEAG